MAERAGARLRLSGDHTVVALAGATGSGKSSTFNAVTGLELAAIGVRRPTTSWTMACAWGADGAGELLDWLGVPQRHQVLRDSMLDEPARGPRPRRAGAARPARPRLDRGRPPRRGRPAGQAGRPAGVGARPAEVRRRRDPRPLPPAAGHAPRHHAGGPQPHRRGARGAASRDGRRPEAAARRRTASTGVPVIATSARHGDGIPELRSGDRRAGERQEGRRGAADGRRRRGRPAGCADANGDAKPGDVARDRKARPRRRVRRRRRGADRGARRRAVHPPPGRPGDRLAGHGLAVPAQARPAAAAAPRPRLPAARSSPARARASVPEATPVQRARVDTAVRAVADDVGAELSPPWAAAVRRASVSRLRRPQRRARQGGRRHRPRGRPHAGVVAAGPGAPVGAHARPRSPGGLWLRRARGDGLPPAAGAGDPATTAASRCRRCCCSAGSALGILLGLVCKAGGRRVRAPQGALGRPAAARGDRRGHRTTGGRAGRGRGRGLPRRPGPG